MLTLAYVSRLSTPGIRVKIMLMFYFQHLGDSTEVLKQLAAGTHPFSKTLASASNPIVVVGSEALQRADGGSIMSLVQQIADKTKVKHNFLLVCERCILFYRF